MKKLLSLLALAVLVSSCGNKLTLMKRHYTKGYYWQGSKQVDKLAVKAAKSQSVARVEPSAPAFIRQVPEAELHAELRVGPGIPSPAYRKQLVSHTLQLTAVKHPHKIASQKHVELKALKETGQRKGDANLVVMVILALFPILCLIAVYLHDGGITTNFWIDLILHLTLIGEIIFALLVVLDVVSFA